MIYSSLDNPKIKEIKKLKEKKYRDLNGEFLIEGEHLIEEAYKAGVLKLLILEEGSTYSLDVDTIYVTKEILNNITSLENVHIMGVASKLESKGNMNRVLICDGIQDPGNLGTMIRSSVAFNVDTIFLSNDTVDLYNPKVIRSTQGLIFNVNFQRGDIVDFIKKLKDNGIYVYGTKINEGKVLKNVAKSEKFAIIMGNEGRGMSPNLEPLLDEVVTIPINPICESLNVGVASSIILYELDK